MELSNIEDILLLLNLLKCDYNEFDNFANRYFEPHVLGTLCIQLEEWKYIKVYNQKYVITKLGKKFLAEENNKLNKKGIDKNIGILSKYFIEKIDNEDIFIPNIIKF